MNGVRSEGVERARQRGGIACPKAHCTREAERGPREQGNGVREGGGCHGSRVAPQHAALTMFRVLSRASSGPSYLTLLLSLPYLPSSSSAWPLVVSINVLSSE